MQIAYCLDQRYLRPCIVSLRSLMFSWTTTLDHWSTGIIINFVISSTSDEETNKKIYEIILREQLRPFVFNVIWVKEVLPYKAIASYISEATQLRLRLVEYIECDRLLYLDCDTIVIGDLGHLQNYEMCHSLAAVPMDTNVMQNSEWNGGKDYKGTTCFNAGVLLLNLNRLRLEGFSEYYMKLLDETHLNDQSVLNLFCQGNYDSLSACYNVFPQDWSMDEAYEKAIVLHWCCRVKPWNATCACSGLWKLFDELCLFTYMEKNHDYGMKKPLLSVFDSDQYVHYNSDLTGMGSQELKNHFLCSGFNKRRIFYDPFFDRAFTKEPYACYAQDVRRLKNASYQNWLVDFIQCSSLHTGSSVFVDCNKIEISSFVKCLSEVTQSCVVLSSSAVNVKKKTPENLRTQIWNYEDDPTLLYYMLICLKPHLVVFFGNSTAVTSVAVYFPKSITCSNDTPIKPFLSPKYLSRMEDMSRNNYVGAKYTTLLRLKARGRSVVIICGELCGDENLSLFNDIIRLLPEIIFIWIGASPEEANSALINGPTNLMHVSRVENRYWILFNLADLLVFTSLVNSFPYEVLEALYFGVSCLTFKNHYPFFRMHHSLDGYPSPFAGATIIKTILAAPSDEHAIEDARAYLKRHYTTLPLFLQGFFT